MSARETQRPPQHDPTPVAGADLLRVPSHPHAWIWWVGASQLAVIAIWLAWGWRAGLPALLLSHALVLVPVFRARSQVYAPVLSRLPLDTRRVWLTIDDGPSDDTLPILDLLDRHQAKATFFLVGARAQARPQLVAEIVRRGHGVGNHSHTHPQAWFWALGPRRMRDEVLRAQATLTTLTGQPPRWFRSVVGMTNPFVAAPLRDAGLTRVAWNARGYDAVRADPATVVARIERDLAPGAIVLLHEGAPHGRSVETIALLLRRLDALGYGSVLPEALMGASAAPCAAAMERPQPSLPVAIADEH
ncbi:polysaccharide deacetylase family protein [Luteimonas yindakuii]|uniref:Polysaccharide deacetylase family protein n=1 Tax=Luteimonas yindakuii TaxID=2565782 RepID=A0A4Z1R6A0_9GAMM|nr:polysaccharide deacetylase family protein [Luteimonas yindakuii]